MQSGPVAQAEPPSEAVPAGPLKRLWRRLTRGTRAYAAERPWRPLRSVLAKPSPSESEDLQRRALTLSLLTVPFVFLVLAVSLLDDLPVATTAVLIYALPFLAVTWWMLDEPSARRIRIGATALMVGSVAQYAIGDADAFQHAELTPFSPRSASGDPSSTGKIDR